MIKKIFIIIIMVMILNFSGYADENKTNILNIEKVVVNIDIGVKEKNMLK